MVAASLTQPGMSKVAVGEPPSELPRDPGGAAEPRESRLSNLHATRPKAAPLDALSDRLRDALNVAECLQLAETTHQWTPRPMPLSAAPSSD